MSSLRSTTVPVVGRPCDLATLPIQYADYAVWQRRWFADTELERQLSYWREQLRGAPEVIDLPRRPATAAGDRLGRQELTGRPAG